MHKFIGTRKFQKTDFLRVNLTQPLVRNSHVELTLKWKTYETYDKVNISQSSTVTLSHCWFKFCLHITAQYIYFYICIYELLSLYHVSVVYIFKADHLILHNRLCKCPRRRLFLPQSENGKTGTNFLVHLIIKSETLNWIKNRK